MKKHNLLTYKDKRNFTFRRNGYYGSLHFMQTSLNNMIKTDMISGLDKIILQQALKHINYVIDNWDKHYCAKLFKQMEAERC